MDQLSFLGESLLGTNSLWEVLRALQTIRVKLIKEEYSLQEEIARTLRDHRISFEREYKLASKNRIDFLVTSGIGIEVKKGKPNRSKVIEQMQRYTAFEKVQILILVVERNLDIPTELNGKKCISFGLNRLWGVALR